ncbi:MAG: CARDB domain-containing protein [Methanomassiliicoccales archaeon]
MSGNISVVWEDLKEKTIYYSRSVDGGKNFPSNVRVDDAIGIGANRLFPAVAVNNSGAIFVVWSDDRAGTSRIYFSMSKDNGTTFSPNVPVNSTYGPVAQSSPDIAISNGTIIVVWAEAMNQTQAGYQNIYMSRSLNWGQTFEYPVRIDNTGVSLTVQAFPRIAARNNSVFVVWHDNRTNPSFDIYGSYSNNSGASFGPNVKVSDGKPGTRHAMADAAIMPDGNPCAVWHDGRSGDLKVRFARSNNSGASFLPSVLVDDSAQGTAQSNPRVAVDSGGNISVVYRDNSLGSYHVNYSFSRNSGTTFSSTIRVDSVFDNLYAANSADVATDANGTPMIVYDYNSAVGFDVYFTKMIDRLPICRINSPADGAIVRGNVTVVGNASDPNGNGTLVNVQIQVLSVNSSYDSHWLVANGTVAWDFVLNTTTLVNGLYELQARSYDGQAYSEIVKIRVTVLNQGQKWPDLAITANDITFSPAQPEANQLVTISVAVWNIGNLNATNVTVSFWRWSVSSGNTSIGDTHISQIPFGQNRIASVQWLALQGNHLIWVKVDPENTIVELNKTNNEASKMISVLPLNFYLPDLTIPSQNFTLSSYDIRNGDSVVLNATVFNIGNKDAENVIVNFTVDGTQVGMQQFISYIPINGSRPASVTWVATTGHHVLNVTVDPTDQILERNKTNNRATIEINVKAGGGEFPIWIIVAGVVIALALAVSIIYVMKWRRPKY